MKVRVTHEISDDARVALSLALDGTFSPATRETLEGWLTETIGVELGDLESKYQEATAELLKKLRT